MSVESKDPWKQLEDILDRALDLNAEERAKFLISFDLSATRRQMLDSLILAAEDEPTLFDLPGKGLWSEDSPAEELEIVGPYRLLELLGRGGMGAVYLAERTDGVYSTRVAVKLLQGRWLDPGVVQRFLSEREILAALRHPNIARLLDGGATEDGRPYLVMEWVDGVPVDRWCEDHQASVEERLRLFVKVCSAVHTAHQNLVVHRDLKPGNILVTADGEPKLLDFGIAKLLDQTSLPRSGAETATGLAPMTPAYASPEQIVGGSVTTSTDVYALGVLLYELLSGRRPHQVAADQNAFELLRAIREQEPTRPSQVVSSLSVESLFGLPVRRLARRLRGDLDHIALKALEKDPSRRYPSAEQLAADIERHLDGLPVEASSAGFAYRATKFVGRHRLAVTASALALSLLLGSLMALLLQRQATLAERDRAELTTGFLVNQFHDADPFAESAPRTVRALLDRSVERLKAMEAPPAVQTDLEAAMGRAYLGLGESSTARRLLESAIAGHTRDGDREGLFQSLTLLSEVEVGAGRPEHALNAARRALELAENPREESLALTRSAHAEQRRGHFRDAEPLFQKAYDLSPAGGRERAELQWNIGMLLREDGRYDEAEIFLRGALELLNELWGPSHPRTTRATLSLGILAGDRGDFDQARELLSAADRALEEHLGPSHPERIAVWIHSARVERLAGDLDQAENLLRRALEALRAQTSGSDPRLAEAAAEMGNLLSIRRRFDEAEPLLLEALAMRRGIHGERHPEVAESLEHMGMLHVRQGKDESAIEHFAQAYTVIAATLGPGHPLCGVYLRHQGNAWLRLERYDQALAVLEQAQGVLEPRLGSSNNHVAALHNSLGYAHHQLGKLDAGRKSFHKAVTGMEQAWGKTHPRVGLYRNNLARLELDAGNFDLAWKEAEAARELLETGLPYEHSHRLRNEVLRARCLIALGRAGEAEPILRPRLVHLDAQPSPNSQQVQSVLDALVQVVEARGGRTDDLRRRLESLEGSSRG